MLDMRSSLDLLCTYFTTFSRFPWLRLIPGPIRQKWEGAQYSLGQQWNLFERELHSHEETFSESKVRDFIDAYLIHVAGKDNKDPLAFAGMGLCTLDARFSWWRVGWTIFKFGWNCWNDSFHDSLLPLLLKLQTCTL